MMSTGVMKESRRERLRLHYLAATKITTAGGRVVSGNLRDIGIDSLFTKIEKKQSENLFQGEQVDVAIIVNQGASRLTITTPGTIIRGDDDGVAIIFAEPLKWWPIFSLFPINEHFLFDVVTKA
jgi:hypothetical protein